MWDPARQDVRSIYVSSVVAVLNETDPRHTLLTTPLPPHETIASRIDSYVLRQGKQKMESSAHLTLQGSSSAASTATTASSSSSSSASSSLPVDPQAQLRTSTRVRDQLQQKERELREREEELRTREVELEKREKRASVPHQDEQKTRSLIAELIQKEMRQQPQQQHKQKKRDKEESEEEEEEEKDRDGGKKKKAKKEEKVVVVVQSGCGVVHPHHLDHNDHVLTSHTTHSRKHKHKHKHRCRPKAAAVHHNHCHAACSSVHDVADHEESETSGESDSDES